MLKKEGLSRADAGIAQLVEHKLPKLGVAGSNPVARSIFTVGLGLIPFLRLSSKTPGWVDLLQIADMCWFSLLP